MNWLFKEWDKNYDEKLGKYHLQNLQPISWRRHLYLGCIAALVTLTVISTPVYFEMGINHIFDWRPFIGLLVFGGFLMGNVLTWSRKLPKNSV